MKLDRSMQNLNLLNAWKFQLSVLNKNQDNHENFKNVGIDLASQLIDES